jgi:hypothetical protein
MKARETDIPADVRVARLVEALERLARLYADRSLPHEAERWRRELERHRPAPERQK